MSTTYSNKSNAKRAAKKAGVKDAIFEQVDGRWVFRSHELAKTTVLVDPLQVEALARAAAAMQAKILPFTKKHSALHMVMDQPATAYEIASALDITIVAAKSLIGDLRRAGIKIVNTDGAYKAVV